MFTFDGHTFCSYMVYQLSVVLENRLSNKAEKDIKSTKDISTDSYCEIFHIYLSKTHAIKKTYRRYLPK